MSSEQCTTLLKDVTGRKNNCDECDSDR
jgi:hypothetical protein